MGFYLDACLFNFSIFMHSYDKYSKTSSANSTHDADVFNINLHFVAILFAHSFVHFAIWFECSFFFVRRTFYPSLCCIHTCTYNNANTNTYTYIPNISEYIYTYIYKYVRDSHKIAIYYIYDTNTRWLLSCNILARMYKYTNKKTKSLKDVLFRYVDTDFSYISICAHTHSRTRTHTQLYECIHTHTYAYIHAHKYTHTHTHTFTLIKIRLALVIYRNPLKSLGDFLSFSWFVHFLLSVMFTIYLAWDFGYRSQCIQISYVYSIYAHTHIYTEFCTMFSFLSIWLANIWYFPNDEHSAQYRPKQSNDHKKFHQIGFKVPLK